MAAAFVILLLCAIGAPLPGTLFLLALGSFVSQGDVELWEVQLIALGAVVLGDQVGYGIGRLGGRRAVDSFARRFGKAEALDRAQAFSARWGAPGIFFTRWLVTALGPWVNLSSGVAAYPWPRFLFWGVLGELVWVGAYVNLGRLFSNRVQDMADIIGNLGWGLLALALAVLSGWALVRELRKAGRARQEAVEAAEEARSLDQPAEEHLAAPEAEPEVDADLPSNA